MPRSDFVVTADTDKLIYIDEDLSKHELGGGGDTETTQEHEVQLGTGGSIGGLETGDTIPVGTTLDELIQMLTQVSVPATYTQPGVTCRVSSGMSASSYEVGTEINTTIQGTFTQNDAGALTSIEIKPLLLPQMLRFSLLETKLLHLQLPLLTPKVQSRTTTLVSLLLMDIFKLVLRLAVTFLSLASVTSSMELV